MSKALGIINFSGNHIWVKGLQSYRPIGAMSFLGRYRVIDFPLSNMSNSGIDQIQVYILIKSPVLLPNISEPEDITISTPNVEKSESSFLKTGLKTAFMTTKLQLT